MRTLKTHIRMHVCTGTHIHTETHAYRYTHVCTYTHTCAHVCIYTLTYIHTHAHRCTHLFQSQGSPQTSRPFSFPPVTSPSTSHSSHRRNLQILEMSLFMDPCFSPSETGTRALGSSGCPGSQLVCSAAPQPAGSRAHHCPDGPLGSGLVPAAPTWTLPLSLQTPASPRPRVPAPGRASPASGPEGCCSTGQAERPGPGAESLHLQSSHLQATGGLNAQPGGPSPTRGTQASPGHGTHRGSGVVGPGRQTGQHAERQGLLRAKDPGRRVTGAWEIPLSLRSAPPSPLSHPFPAASRRKPCRALRTSPWTYPLAAWCPSRLLQRQPPGPGGGGGSLGHC